MLLPLIIFLAVVFIVLSLIYRRNQSPPVLVGMLLTGALTLGLGVFDSFNKVTGSGEINKARNVSEQRLLVQAEYFAKVASADVGKAVFLKDETRPGSAVFEEGFRKGFGADVAFEVFTGGSEDFEFGVTEEVFQFDARMIAQAVKSMGGEGLLIFSESPGPIVMARPFLRRYPHLKLAVLDMTDKKRAELLSKRRINYVVLSRPYEERRSEKHGKFPRDLKAAFEGDFELLTK